MLLFASLLLCCLVLIPSGAERQAVEITSQGSGSSLCFTTLSAVLQRQAFGLFKPFSCINGSNPSDPTTLLESDVSTFPFSPHDGVRTTNLAPRIAVALGSNGTVLHSNEQAVTFHQLTETDGDITSVMHSGGGWSLVMALKMRSTSVITSGLGVVAALTDDVGSNSSDGAINVVVQSLVDAFARVDVNATDKFAALSKLLFFPTSISPQVFRSVFLAVLVDHQAQVLGLLTPVIGNQIATFHVPELFDGQWHIAGIVFDTIAFGIYGQISLHLDGKNPRSEHLQRCVRRRDAFTPLPHTPEILLNGTPNGALTVGAFNGSFHSLVLYDVALTRISIASLGTATTQQRAAEMAQYELYMVGTAFTVAALVLFAVSVVHGYREYTESRHTEIHHFLSRIIALIRSAETITDSPVTLLPADKVLADDADDHYVGSGQWKQNGGIVSTATAGVQLGGVQAVKAMSLAKSAISAMQSSSPVARTSASLIVMISSWSLQVPQQMSVLLSSMTFPAKFREVFSNVFSMISIKFNFPEINIPAYVPLFVVLALAVAVLAYMISKVSGDHRVFLSGLRQWNDQRIAYEILAKVVVRESFVDRQNIIDTTMATPINPPHVRDTRINFKINSHSPPEDKETAEKIISDVVAVVVESYPTPAGALTRGLTDGVISEIIDTPTVRNYLRRLRSSFSAYINKTPSDAVESLVMCFAVAMRDEVIRPADVDTISLKIRTMFASYDKQFLDEVRSLLDKDGTDVESTDVEAEVERISQLVFDDTVTDQNSAAAERRRCLVSRVLVRHVRQFVQAVLGWVCNTDDETIATFMEPFVTLYFATNKFDPKTPNEVTSLSDVPKNDEVVRAAAFRNVVRRQAAQSGTNLNVTFRDSAPVQRQYYWHMDKQDIKDNSENSSWADYYHRRSSLRGGAEVPIDPWEVRWRHQYLAAALPPGEGRRCVGCYVVTVSASHKCPEHQSTLIPPTDAHYEAVAMDGRPVFRCCNTEWEAVKQLLHKHHEEADECDAGQVYVCPEDKCSFTLCDRCFEREDKNRFVLARMYLAGLWYRLRRMNPPVQTVVGLILLDALSFPATQLPVLVLSCHPSFSCWLDECYTTMGTAFLAAAVVSVLLLSFRGLLSVGFWMELRRRKALCVRVFSQRGNLRDNVQSDNHLWQHFMHYCDRSLLRSMYMGTELLYIDKDPIWKLLLDVGVVVAASFLPEDSFVQKAVLGGVYCAYGLMLAITNPNLLLALDVLAKAVIIHQLLAMGLMNFHLGLSIAEGEDSPRSILVVWVMIVVTTIFLAYAGTTIGRFAITPFLRSIRDSKLSALVRRDAQAAAMTNSISSLAKRARLLFATFAEKRKHQHSYFSKRTSSQVAVTASLLLQLLATMRSVLDTQSIVSIIVHRGSRQVRASLLNSPNRTRLPDEKGAAQDPSQEAQLVLELERRLLGYVGEWLRCNVDESPGRNGFYSSRARHHHPHSFESRQLEPYESCALGFALRAIIDADKSVEATLLEKALKSCHPALNETFVPCNQLQILAAAQLTDGLDFSDCNLATARLPSATRFTSCDFTGADFSFVSLPDCRFGRCTLVNTTFGHRNIFHGRMHHFVVPTTSSVLCVAMSPDGVHAASGSEDCTVQLWNTRSGELVRVFRGHEGPVTCVCFSPDGRQVATASKDGSARLWTISSESSQSLPLGNGSAPCDATLLAQHAHCTVPKISLKPLPAGRSISGRVSIGVRKLCPRDESASFVKDHDAVVAFSPCGQQVVTTSHKSIDFWLASTGSTWSSIGVEKATTIAYSPDGQFIACGTRDGLIVLLGPAPFAIHSVSEQDLPRRVLDHYRPHRVTSLQFSPNGSFLASGGHFSVRIWNFNRISRSSALNDDPRPSFLELRRHTSEVTHVAFSSDSTRLLSSSRDCCIRVWDVVSGDENALLAGHSNAVTSAVFTPDSTRVMSGAEDNTIRIWELTTDTSQQLGGTIGVCTRIEFLDAHHFVTLCDEAYLRFWSCSSGAEVFPFRGIVAHTDMITCFDISPDGTRIATGSRDKTVSLWDVPKGSVIRNFHQHDSSVSAVSILADLSVLASVDSDGFLQVSKDEIVAQKVLCDKGYVRQLLCCRLGLLVFHDSGVVELRDVTDVTRVLWDSSENVKQKIRCLAAPQLRDTVPAFFLGTHDGHLQMWRKAAHGDYFVSASNIAGHIICIAAASPSKLICGLADQTIRIYRIASSAGIALELAEVGVVCAHAQEITNLAVATDGRAILSSSRDKSVKLWETTQIENQVEVVVTDHPLHAISWNASLPYCVVGGSRGFLSCVSTQGNPQRFPSFSLREFSENDVAALSISGGPGKYIATVDGPLIHVHSKAHNDFSKCDTLKGHVGTVRTLAFSTFNSTDVLASGGEDNRVLLWFPVGGKWKCTRLTGQLSGVSSVCFDASSTLLAAAGRDGVFRLWRIVSVDDEKASFDSRGAFSVPCAIHCVMFVNDQLVCACGDSHIRVWGLSQTTFSCVAVLSGHTGAVLGLAVARDGIHIASHSADEVFLWHLRTGVKLRNFVGHNDKVTAVAFSTQSEVEFLVSASKDKTVRYWRWKSCRPKSFGVAQASDHTRMISPIVMEAICIGGGGEFQAPTFVEH